MVYEGGSFRVKGWTCEPGLGQTIGVKIQVGSVVHNTTPIGTNQWAEPDVHQMCGTSPSSGLAYRYSVALPFYSLSGQAIHVTGMSSLGMATLTQSGQLSLPPSATHPDVVLANASRILVYTAHPDDETLFAPLLGKHCPTKTCKIVVATKGGGPGAVCLLGAGACGPYNSQTGYAHIESIRASEMQTAAAHVPAALGQGVLSSGDSSSVQIVRNRWASEMLAMANMTLAQAITSEINSFAPNVILTLDPRHGTTCHNEHRAVGQEVVQAVQVYSGSAFDKDNLFVLTTRYTVTPIGTGFTPAAPTDKTSTVYSANDYLPSRGKSGWSYLLENIGYHPSQFSSSYIASGSAAEDLDRTTALQRVKVPDYSATDPRYTFCP